MQKPYSTSILLAVLGATIASCSGEVQQYGTASFTLTARRAAGTNEGEFLPTVGMANRIDAAAASADASALPKPAFELPPEEAASDAMNPDGNSTDHSSPSSSSSPSAASTPSASSTGSSPTSSSTPAAGTEQTVKTDSTTKPTADTAPASKSVDASLLGGCLEKLNVSPKAYSSYKVVDLSGKNANNSVLYEDPATSAPSLILLRLIFKNVNAGQLKLLNPKSTYCIDMQVNNANSFKFSMSCEAKVGFVRLVKKNSNTLSTEVTKVECGN